MPKCRHRCAKRWASWLPKSADSPHTPRPLVCRWGALLCWVGRRMLSVPGGRSVPIPPRGQFVICDTPGTRRGEGLRPGNFINVFPNMLYLYLLSTTRCSVSDTGRAQVDLVGRDAPAGSESQLTRTTETGILRPGGSLN